MVSQNGDSHPWRFDDPQIRVVYTKTAGLGIAFRNGIAAADSGYFYYLSPDLPFDLGDLALMLKSEADLVLGSKLHPDSKYDIELVRKLGSYGFYALTRMILPDFPVKDPNGSWFGKVSLLQPIAKVIRADDFFYAPEFIYRVHKAGLTIEEVPVVYVDHSQQTSSVNVIRHGWAYLKQLVAFRYANVD